MRIMEYVKFNGIDKKISKFFMGTFGMFPDNKEKHFQTPVSYTHLGRFRCTGICLESKEDNRMIENHRE